MSQTETLSDFGVRLHRRMIENRSAVVTAQVAEAFLPVLVNALERSLSHLIHRRQIEEAVVDSLLDYFAEPQRFDPAQSTLLHYLYRGAAAGIGHVSGQAEKVVALSTQLDEYVIDDALELNAGACQAPTIPPAKMAVRREESDMPRDR